MPPRRSTSKTVQPAALALPLAEELPIASQPRRSLSDSKRTSTNVTDEAARIVQAALEEARKASGTTGTTIDTPRRASNVGRSSTRVSATPAAAAAVDAKDGEVDTAPEGGSVTGGFFSARDRVYSRATTQCLTDVAGLFLLTFLAFYFSLSGYWFYQELSKSSQ